MELAEQVVFVAEAIRIIERLYEPTEVALPFVIARKAYELDVALPIFDSLREGYPEFDTWFRDKCAGQQRDCWTIEIDGNIVGIVIYKEENKYETDAYQAVEKVLKLCTFKMQPDYRGERFGEQLLKQALWYAYRNDFDTVYLTAFDDQPQLMSLLTQFGFFQTYRNERGESVLEKKISYGRNLKPGGMPAIQMNKILYPNFYEGPDISKYIIPINSRFHEILFPEFATRQQPQLFSHYDASSHGINSSRTPGNTIRKVYISRTGIKRISPGDIVIFYVSKDADYLHSQSATSFGIVEGFSEAKDFPELTRMASKRSVFSNSALEGFFTDNTNPVKVMDFLLIGHFEEPVKLRDLVKMNVCRGQAPQSAASISDAGWSEFQSSIKLRP